MLEGRPDQAKSLIEHALVPIAFCRAHKELQRLLVGYVWHIVVPWIVLQKHEAVREVVDAS